jgi:DNA (cytosine-5)-methyltransferase 1
VEVLQPDWFLFENVPSIRSHKSFCAIQRRFENLKATTGGCLDYEIHWGIFTAADFGVPQERNRFILIGKRKNHRAEWVEPPTRDRLTVADAISDLPRIPAGHSFRQLAYRINRNSGFQKLMRSGWLEGEAKGLYDHVCRGHQDDDIQLFRRMEQGERFADQGVQQKLREINPKHHLLKYSTKDFVDKLHKLDNSRSAWTVTAHLQKDSYKFIHPSQGRTISVREAARLQSFPDWFRFSNIPMCAAFRLIGNAVPPLMAFSFAEQIASADASRPVQSACAS